MHHVEKYGASSCYRRWYFYLKSGLKRLRCNFINSDFCVVPDTFMDLFFNFNIHQRQWLHRQFSSVTICHSCLNINFPSDSHIYSHKHYYYYVHFASLFPLHRTKAQTAVIPLIPIVNGIVILNMPEQILKIQ
jgi:hypothetical protein